VPGWGDDPELLATFRAEVDDRLAALGAGLLTLEGHPSPRSVVPALFRDAHTVKGSARMLGVDPVVGLAHHLEDVLAAVRDGRLAPRPDVVDLLLASCDAIGRLLPGAEAPLDPGDVGPLRTALAAVLTGRPVPAVARPGSALPRQAGGASSGLADPEPAAPPSPAATAPLPPPASTAPLPPPASTAPPEPADPPPPPAAAPPEPATRPRRAELPSAPAASGSAGSVRVAASKVYDLLDVVGETELGARRVQQGATTLLALTNEVSRHGKAVRDALPPGFGAEHEALRALTEAHEALAASSRLLRELAEGHCGRVAVVRDAAMGLAMVPVRRVTTALPRLVREVASSAGRQVHLDVVGEDVELDKQVLDGVADALKHLVINAVDHGCEAPAERRAAGKDLHAVVRVSARSAGGTVVIEVSDDGRGIDPEAVRLAAVDKGLLPVDAAPATPDVLQLLFTPAFSTAKKVTETSGRGVGLDVVRDAVEDLAGTVELHSTPGAGSTFRLTLPVTLGVLRCLVASVGGERYALPLPSVVESMALRDADVHTLAGSPVLTRHGASVPLLDLGSALGQPGAPVGPSRGSGRQAVRRAAALVVRHGERSLAWAVDGVQGERELVVKDLGSFLGRLPLVAGATIDSDGTVVCLLDLRELSTHAAAARPATARVGASTTAVLPGDGARTPHAAARGRDGARRAAAPARVLVVEDSVGVRELERAILEGAGYHVETAVDGGEGAGRLTGEPFDLVLSDVEMPGLDGFALTRQVRRTPGWEHVPVVLMTSRNDPSDARSGLAAGASAYLFKQDFDSAELVRTVRRLIGR